MGLRSVPMTSALGNSSAKSKAQMPVPVPVPKSRTRCGFQMMGARKRLPSSRRPNNRR